METLERDYRDAQRTCLERKFTEELRVLCQAPYRNRVPWDLYPHEGERENKFVCDDAFETMVGMNTWRHEEFEPILVGEDKINFACEDVYEGMQGTDAWHDLGGEG